MSISLRISLLSLLVASPAFAADYTVTLKDHAFTPAELTVPAGEKVKLTVKNASDAAMEFESSDFDREKVITAGHETTVLVGPLKAGKYEFFDDFHPASKGTIIAK